MSARDRSPRPAESLPPTLLPNPVLMAAPSPDRMTSLLVACTVYCALGGAVLGGTRHLVTHPPKTTTTFILTPREGPELPEVKLPPQPTGGSPRPEGFKTIEPEPNRDVVPDVTPTTVPTLDQSHFVAASPDPGVGPRIEGLPTNTVPTPPVTTVRSTTPVAFEFTQIRILQQVSPVYPALARMIKAQGPVELRMTINTSGVPTDVEVISGPHPLLINEALRVARLWRFQPAMVDGSPVTATFRLTVGFRLER
jgi:periplasmic protein TonB